MTTPAGIRVASVVGAVFVLICADADLAVRCLAAVGIYALGVGAWIVVARTAPAPAPAVPLDLTGQLRRTHTANDRTPPTRDQGCGRPTPKG